MNVRGIPVVLAAIGWLLASSAMSDCSDVLAVYRAPPPPAAFPTNAADGTEETGCNAAELAMLQANHVAIAEARAPTDPVELVGTWLGDDVLLYVAGIAVPGQEVLRIAPGDAPGSLDFIQLWYKASTPNTPSLLYRPSEGYLGLVSEGHLDPLGPPGEFRVDPFALESIRYGATRLEFERSHDLWMRNRLNRFERPLRFRLAGDTLVIDGEEVRPISREGIPRVDTFTRVADEAPDFALLLVAYLERSQTLCFESFVHQLSAGAGPLLDAMAPASPETVRAAIEALVANELQIEQLRGEELTEAQRATLQALIEAKIELISAPEFAGLIEASGSNDALGCATLP